MKRIRRFRTDVGTNEREKLRRQLCKLSHRTRLVFRDQSRCSRDAVGFAYIFVPPASRFNERISLPAPFRLSRRSIPADRYWCRSLKTKFRGVYLVAFFNDRVYEISVRATIAVDAPSRNTVPSFLRRSGRSETTYRFLRGGVYASERGDRNVSVRFFCHLPIFAGFFFTGAECRVPRPFRTITLNGR